MKLPSFDKDLKADQAALAAEGVVGVVAGLTMLGHPKTAHVRFRRRWSLVSACYNAHEGLLVCRGTGVRYRVVLCCRCGVQLSGVRAAMLRKEPQSTPRSGCQCTVRV